MNYGSTAMGWAIGVALLATSATAQAEGLHAHEGHERPPAYNDPDFAVPPASGAAPQYPRAVAFVPADASNYTPGGITSYDYVVVHTMQGYYGGSISWFQNPSANVSAHYCMRAEDGEVTQMVRNEDRAWHVNSINPQAIGIEHEGFIDEPQWYTWINYVESAYLARWLCDTYDIPLDRDHIVGHVELPGNSHTDPGNNWNWDLYMGLVRQTVPEATVEAIVVDRTQACTVTATEATVIKRTTEPSADLDASDVCAVASGDTITFDYEFDGFDGHRRMLLDPDDPCAGTFGTDPVYLFEGHVSGACDNAVVEGVDVVLDGGTVMSTDASGVARFTDVAAGGHEVTTDGELVEVATVPFDLDVYPGARVLIVTATAHDGGEGTGGDDPTDGGATSSADESSGGAPSGTGDGTSDDTPPGGETSDGGTEASAGALPDGFGERDASGCGCRTSRRPDLFGLAAFVFAFGWVRRRRASA